MLRTNSKKAMENIKNYILENFTPESYEEYADLECTADYRKACTAIMNIFNLENAPVGTYARMTERERFIDWCQGLPSILDTCYYYNRSAVDDLGQILEETDTEKSKYDELEAENMLSNLLYREIKKNAEV